jgi:hypothetical protein
VDGVIPPDMGHIYKELMPNCHLVFVYDAAHAISTDRPEAFTEVVADFLERHEAFVISRTETGARSNAGSFSVIAKTPLSTSKRAPCSSQPRQFAVRGSRSR